MPCSYICTNLTSYERQGQGDMDSAKFQSEITDRLGNTPVAFSLKNCFSNKYELVKTAGEIRIRAGMPLCIIGGNKNDRIYRIHCFDWRQYPFCRSNFRRYQSLL